MAEHHRRVTLNWVGNTMMPNSRRCCAPSVTRRCRTRDVAVLRRSHGDAELATLLFHFCNVYATRSPIHPDLRFRKFVRAIEAVALHANGGRRRL